MKTIAAIAFVIFTIQFSLGSDPETFSFKNMVAGNYTLTTDKSQDNFTELLQVLHFKDEDIKQYKEHPTAGNIQVKILDDSKQMIEMIADTPLGIKKSIIIKGGESFEAETYDGRKYTGKAEFPSSDKLRIEAMMKDGGITCQNNYVFFESGLVLNYDCENKNYEGGKKIKLRFDYRRENY